MARSFFAPLALLFAGATALQAQNQVASPPAPIAAPIAAPTSASTAAPTSPETATAAASPLNTALASSQLRVEGQRPFHLKIGFQLYDLVGSPSEQGTVEEWWAGPAGMAVTYTAPSFGTVHHAGTSDLKTDAARRSLYLAEVLRTEVLGPTFPHSGPNVRLLEEQKTLGQVVLHCTTATAIGAMAPARVLRELCLDESNTYVRLISDPVQTVLRTRDAKFANTRVALALDVLELGRKAISGKVEELRSFDPASSPVTLSKGVTSAPVSKDTSEITPGTVHAGKVLKRVDPIYPLVARQAGVSGTVILGGTISVEGTVENLYPLATADKMLVPAAMEAVKRWVYEPYLLLGSPVAVHTFITVNFSLNPSGPR